MSDSDSHLDSAAACSPKTSGMTYFLWNQLPYVVALVLARRRLYQCFASALVGYWEFLALAIGVVCVISKWADVDSKAARWQLVWTQALHWIAVLVTMNIVLVSGVQQLLPTPAVSLVLLTLLALGTFLAGVSLLSLQIAFLGVAMSIAVPAISWLKQSIIFFLLGAVLLVGLGITFWLRQDSRPHLQPAGTKSRTEA